MTASRADAGWVGAGIGYRRRHRAELLAAAAHTDARPVLEVVPDHFFARPEDIDELAERFTLVFHSVGLSPGTAGDGAGASTARQQLARIRELCRRARPLLVSDHLALTRSPSGIDLGHLAPLWPTPELAGLVVDRVRQWQDALGVPVALENIAHGLAIPDPPMTEPELLHRVVEATGCGLLLDVTNLLYDARNQGFDPEAWLSDYPLDAVAQLHLAGGRRSTTDGFWADTHDAPIEEDTFAFLRALRGRARVRFIVVERDDRLPPASELVAEARRAATVWLGQEHPPEEAG